LPQIAPVAIQEARYCAKLIRAELEGRGLPPFVYRDKGTMATIGRRSAVTELSNGLRLAGMTEAAMVVSGKRRRDLAARLRT